MQRTLVTGANGFVGQILCEKLKAAGHYIIALTNTKPSSDLSAHEKIQCDICDASALESVINKSQPTHVVHLAAITNVPLSFKEPVLTWQTNVMGSINLLEGLRKHAPEAFVLFISSSEVYGASFKKGIALDESTPCQPLNPYAASKLAAEAAFNEYFRQGQPGVIARPFNHIGAKQSPMFVTASFARQIALIEAGKQLPELKVGNLDAYRDFLDVQDVCDAYIDILNLSGKSTDYSRCFNICSGTPIKIGDLLNEMLSMSSSKIQVLQDPERMRPSDIPIAQGDSTKIKNITGWEPKIFISETINNLMDYWRSVAHMDDI